ncbi:hypothetical protein OROMI_018568 [Orobanche minor]
MCMARFSNLRSLTPRAWSQICTSELQMCLPLRRDSLFPSTLLQRFVERKLVPHSRNDTSSIDHKCRGPDSRLQIRHTILGFPGSSSCPCSASSTSILESTQTQHQLHHVPYFGSVKGACKKAPLC